MDAAVHQNQREIEEAMGGSTEESADKPLLLEQVHFSISAVL